MSEDGRAMPDTASSALTGPNATAGDERGWSRTALTFLPNRRTARSVVGGVDSRPPPPPGTTTLTEPLDLHAGAGLAIPDAVAPGRDDLCVPGISPAAQR